MSEKTNIDKVIENVVARISGRLPDMIGESIAALDGQGDTCMSCGKRTKGQVVIRG